MENLKRLNKECREDLKEEERDKEKYEKDLQTLSQEETQELSQDVSQETLNIVDDLSLTLSPDEEKKKKRNKRDRARKNRQREQEVYSEERVAMAQVRQFERFRIEGILKQRVMSQTNDLVIVSKSLAERARRVLKERIDNGEDPHQILLVNDEYYEEKILKGLVPMTDLIYCRIVYPEEMK